MNAPARLEPASPSVALSADEFQAVQMASAGACLGELFRACRTRYLASAALLEVRGPSLEALEASVYRPLDLRVLWPMFEALARRYAHEFFSPQAALFPGPQDDPVLAWSCYFHHTCLPALVRSDALVRNVLRATRFIDCQSPAAAAESLVQESQDMALPMPRPVRSWPPGQGWLER